MEVHESTTTQATAQQGRTDQAKRHHVDNNKNSLQTHITQPKVINSTNKISESINKKPHSSLIITNTNTKETTTPLDLNITRRPLSPVHILDPKKVNIKKGNQQQTPNELKIKNPATNPNNNKTNNKTNTTQIKPMSISSDSSASSVSFASSVVSA